MEIKSSTTAKDNKNIFNEGFKYLLNKKYIPIENAMSVEIGIQTPFIYRELKLKYVKIKAGIITPPIDAITGKEAFLKEDKLPYKISSFISKPASKKNIDIKKSLTKLCKLKFFTI